MHINRDSGPFWSEWEGQGFTCSLIDSLVYSAAGHVSLSNNDVFTSLASAVQRDGVADGLGRASSAVQPYSIVHGYSGEVDGLELHVCSDVGETYYGDTVEKVTPTTWVEVLKP
jgi:hypothetical protein